MVVKGNSRNSKFRNRVMMITRDIRVLYFCSHANLMLHTGQIRQFR